MGDSASPAKPSLRPPDSGKLGCGGDNGFGFGRGTCPFSDSDVAGLVARCGSTSDCTHNILAFAFMVTVDPLKTKVDNAMALAGVHLLTAHAA